MASSSTVPRISRRFTADAVCVATRRPRPRMPGRLFNVRSKTVATVTAQLSRLASRYRWVSVAPARAKRRSAVAGPKTTTCTLMASELHIERAVLKSEASPVVEEGFLDGRATTGRADSHSRLRHSGINVETYSNQVSNGFNHFKTFQVRSRRLHISYWRQ